MTALSENWRKKADFEKVKSELGCKAAHPAAFAAVHGTAILHLRGFSFVRPEAFSMIT